MILLKLTALGKDLLPAFYIMGIFLIAGLVYIISDFINYVKQK